MVRCKALFERMIPAALDNLKIAQKRDTQRYARTRDGSYRLQMTRIQEGDFVYRKRQTKTTIDTSSGAVVLRVKHAFDNGAPDLSNPRTHLARKSALSHDPMAGHLAAQARLRLAPPCHGRSRKAP
eukprot:jgi/Mesen1/1704/ME000138S00563